MLVLTIVSLVFCFSGYKLGVVTKISIKEKDDRTELRINYLLASGGYSVRNVADDEGEYTGDGVSDYDGALGEYRILISFGDVALKDSYRDKMDEKGIIRLSRDMRARVAYPSDHGFVLYVGSDKPISVETTSSERLNPVIGRLKISILL